MYELPFHPGSALCLFCFVQEQIHALSKYICTN